MFMDAFQGSYNSGKPERRYFVLWYILLRFLVITSMEYFKYILSIQTISVTLIVGLISVVVFKSYNKSLHIHRRLLFCLVEL